MTQNRIHTLIGAWCALVPCSLAGVSGCGFSERSFVMRAGDLVRIPKRGDASSLTARGWLTDAHRALAHLLPVSESPPLLTEDLSDPFGHARDTLEHFGLESDKLRTLAGNWRGLEESAQVLGPDVYIDQAPPKWNGFEDVWVPVGDGVRLSGRLGLARDASGVRHADCVVLVPGLFGDNGILRTRDMANALVAAGLHVLALELRGHGRTEGAHPGVPFTFGVFETVDLLLVSEWLEARPEIGRTGLVGYCMGANVSLLAAWYDGHRFDDDAISSGLAARLPDVSESRHFSAGILAFSPPLNFESLLDELETPRAVWSDPILANLQETVRERLARKGDPAGSGSLRALIVRELSRAGLTYPGATKDCLEFGRLMTTAEGAREPKLSRARVPVLIVHGANDPVCPAQDVAGFVAAVDNPNVAAIVLPGGGHNGFAPYSRSYYFSLVLNFFSADRGIAASARRNDAVAVSPSAIVFTR